MARKPEGDKRRQILDAALRVFAKKGYYKARVTEIARAAGIADGTVYLYFDSKQDIIVSVFSDVVKRHLENARQEIARASTPREKLLAIARHHLTALSESRDVALVFQTELRQSTLLMRVNSQELGGYFALLSALVEAGQKAGDFRDDIPKGVVVQSFFGALDEMVTAWLLSENHYNLVDLAEPMTDLFLGGLGRGSRSPETKAPVRGGRT